MSFLPTTGLTKNPLGIIALFVSLIYGFACLVLSTSISNLKGQEERLPLIWFIILFPIVILIGFLFLVIKHHQKLYSPSDYGNSESFLKTFEGSKKFEAVEVDITKNEKLEFKKPDNLVAKFEDVNLNKGPFSEQTKENVALANSFFKKFLEIVNEKNYRKKLSLLSFGAQAPEYFLLSCTINKKYLKNINTNSKETIIIRVTRDDNGIMTLIGIGKNIMESNEKIFAEKIALHIEKFVFNSIKLELTELNN